MEPVVLAILASLFTWFCTAVGAGLVYFGDRSGKVMDILFGISSGVMLSTSIFSLLIPSLEMHSKESSIPEGVPLIVGFIVGVIFIVALERLLPENGCIKYNENSTLVSVSDTDLLEIEGEEEGISKNLLVLLFAVTIHNIPEGLVLGFSFAASPENGIKSSLILALAIGIQNIPEGLAISIPLRQGGISTFKSFLYGQFSGFVEVIGAIIGALIVNQLLLPYALSFAAGAMIFVVLKELIPRSSTAKGGYGIASTMFGFILMMILEVVLG
eukprot:TRINITY_DN8157_c0_g1_i1.p1 TRINITY_DN8157_c0_g1~~TRINITY_DN8157_c0_g1_i1.p1  ORF type:complete len:271 (-),score=47.47 TRINITY_DN8157_c0_g1_i1:48-860(-)